jgi:hypothetical protein
MVTRHAMIPNTTPKKWHGNWIIVELEISPGFVEQP